MDYLIDKDFNEMHGIIKLFVDVIYIMMTETCDRISLFNPS